MPQEVSQRLPIVSTRFALGTSLRVITERVGNGRVAENHHFRGRRGDQQSREVKGVKVGRWERPRAYPITIHGFRSPDSGTAKCGVDSGQSSVVGGRRKTSHSRILSHRLTPISTDKSPVGGAERTGRSAHARRPRALAVVRQNTGRVAANVRCV